MMRWLLICWLLAVPGVALAQADDDRGYIQGLIEDALSDAGRDVRITGFRGALSASASLEQLTIADADGVWLILDEAQLDWRRAALLSGRLEVDRLSAERLTLTRLPVSDTPPEEDSGFQLPALPPPEASQFALPDLPVSIQIGEVGIASVTLGEAVLGIAAEVSLEGGAQLADGEGTVSLNARRIDGRAGTFELSGSYANDTERLIVDLALSEGADGLVATLLDLPGRPSIDASVAGDGPLSDFTARIGLRTDGIDRFGGAVSVATVTDVEGQTAQRFAADLTGDLTPLLRPDYHAFLGDELSLRLAGQRGAAGGLDLEELRLRAAEIRLDGQLSLSPDAWPTRFDLRGEIAPKDGERVLLALPGPETRLRRAAIDLGFDAALGERWSLSAVLDGFARDAVKLERSEITGGGTLRAGPEAPVARAEGGLRLDLAGLDLGDPALTRAVGSVLRGDLRFVTEENAPLQISDINLAGADYGLTGDIQIVLPEAGASPEVAGDLAVTAADLSRFAELAGQPLGGAVRMDVSGRVIPLDGAFDLTLNGTARDLSTGVAQIDPLIKGTARLAVDAARDAAGTRVRSFMLRTPETELSGSVDISSNASRGTLTAQLQNAALIHPGMPGPAAIDLDFDQTGSEWNVDATASGPGQSQADITLRTPTGSTLSTVSASVSSRDLSAFGWAVGRPLSGGAALNLSGDIDIAARTGALGLTGRTDSLVLGIAELDRLMQGVADLDISVRAQSDAALIIDVLSLRSKRLLADISGSIQPDRTRFRFNVDLPDMAVLVPDLTGPVAAEGVVVTTGGDWQIDTDLRGPGGMQAAIEGALAQDVQSADLTVLGTVPLALANQRLAPNIISGPLSFDLALRGSLEVQSVSGQLSTSAARLSLPQQKIAFDPVRSTIRLAGGQAQVDADLALTTGGNLRVNGPVGLSAPFSGGLTITLASLAVSRPGLVETTVDGQLRIAGPLTGGAQISGGINLGEVGVQVPSSAGPASAAVPGLVHLGEPGAVRQSRARAGLIETGSGASGPGGPPFGLDVLVSAPSRVFIRGRGLDAEMGGSLRIGGTTANVVPSGRFDLIRGRLNILGQRLDLTEGFIQPQGDLDPFMQIVAEATAGSTDVRFVIEGPVTAPELIMTSSPELPEDEILSRFLFGRDLTQISALQALQIASALATLSGRSAGGLQGLRQGVGLDDLDVSTTETGETTVRAGKYISDNVYSDVSRTTDGETEINLNLTLTPSITARGTARTDSSTGIGIFFETDY